MSLPSFFPQSHLIQKNDGKESEKGIHSWNEEQHYAVEMLMNYGKDKAYSIISINEPKRKTRFRDGLRESRHSDEGWCEE